MSQESHRPMHRPQARSPVSYRKPSALNPVSVFVFLMIGAAVYLTVCYWPTMRLKSHVKDELHTSLVQFYRLNLRHDKRKLKDQQALEVALRRSLVQAGVTDPGLKVEVQMNAGAVSLEAHFKSDFELLGLKKTYPVKHDIRVHTDAAKVDW